MLDHAITVRDLLYVSGAAFVLLFVVCAFTLRDFAKELFDVAMHRYIWTGEALTMQDGEARTICRHVKVEGWGAYAAVRLNVGAIRRDCIHKDENGNWLYRYSD
jgi:hypothetical protein